MHLFMAIQLQFWKSTAPQVSRTRPLFITWRLSPLILFFVGARLGCMSCNMLHALWFLYVSHHFSRFRVCVCVFCSLLRAWLM